MVHTNDAPFDQEPTASAKKGIPFAIETVLEDESEASPREWQMGYRFAPTYYPKRFSQETENEISRTPRQCGGEDVYIKNNKNTDLHVNGIVLASNISILRRILNHQGAVDLISPLVENGGIEAVVKSGEIGDIVGWDSLEEQWQFEYTIDLVSTGADERKNHDTNQIVSEILKG